MLCIQYCNFWCHFEKRLGRFYYITCKILLQLERDSVLHLYGLQSIHLRRVISICLLQVILRYTQLGLFAVIIFLFTTNVSFYYVSLLISKKLYLSQKSRINFFVIFCNKMFCYIQVHPRPPKSFDHQHKANIERQGYIRDKLIVVREIINII